MTTETILTDDQIKLCRKCGTAKPYDQFNKRSTAKDGLQSNCRSCSAAQYVKNREAIRARQRETWTDYSRKNRERLIEKNRNRRQGNKLLDAEYRKEYKIRFAPKIAAENAVWSMLLTGRIAKEPCEICGGEPADAHHDDYAKPLSVRWLCRVHHAEWHAINGEALNGRTRAAMQEQKT